MLAQSFKSAADLGIEDAQKDALIKTLTLLETGKLQHSKAFNLNYEEEPPLAFSGQFNMRYWTEAGHNCGTIACIGGTAELISGVRFQSARNDKLRALFQPETIPAPEWNDITTAQAAIALRSYLTTGDAHWDLAVAS